MKFCLLGICGTLMSGVALLLREKGHQVLGCDQNALPPIGDLLGERGIECRIGYAAEDLPDADCYVIGNAVSRGNPMVERILREKRPHRSAPDLLRAEVLSGRQVLVVTGTHGKTTITAMVAAMLQQAGLEPGWLIGGIPRDLDSPARLGAGAPFVIEGDEYDTAFFDKSAKFLHYDPDLLLINNLEFDHADIYPNLAAIQTQFHYLLRRLSDRVEVLVPAGDDAVAEVLERGFWSRRQSFVPLSRGADWTLKRDSGSLEIFRQGEPVARLKLEVDGYHHLHNLLGAFALAVTAGADPAAAARAAENFRGVHRRYELLLDCEGVRLYEDFAHHPTAIAACIAAARPELQPGGRLLAAIDLASNSMKAGSHLENLGSAVAGVDRVFWHGLTETAAEVARRWGGRAFDDAAALSEALLSEVQPGDTLILFSNAHFGGLRQSFPPQLEQHLRTRSVPNPD